MTPPVDGGAAGPKLRAIVRLSSALTLFAFVLCHLVNHSLALVSITLANDAHHGLIDPWRSKVGSLLLLTAALAHYGNALWSVYIRRSLRLPAWQLWQLGLGLTIPLLWMLHFASTRLAQDLLKVTPDYTLVLLEHWVIAPWRVVLQIAMLLTVWSHGCIGIHHWLSSKPNYRRWRLPLLMAAVMLPTLAIAGYVAAGNHVIRQAAHGEFVQDVLDDANMTAAKTAAIDRFAAIGWSLHLILVATPFIARGLRSWRRQSRPRPSLIHSGGRTLAVQPGSTILESLQDAGIDHAAVCGGRGRCTTCRVRVVGGLDLLPGPNLLEAAALQRYDLPAAIRLACQVRPTADLAVVPLLPTAGGDAMRALRGGVAGSEMLVTVAFVDLRDSTRMGEAKLPYDVLFILNQFFHEMTNALTASRGHYANFTGDGLMALYGLDGDPAQGARDAVAGAQEMLNRLDLLNRQLAGELVNPLRIGIGIHSGTAIVGSMGPPRAQNRGALGDTVNSAARLEALTKEHDCAVTLSRQAAELAGIAPGSALRSMAVKGREQPLEFYALSRDQLATI